MKANWKKFYGHINAANKKAAESKINYDKAIKGIRETNKFLLSSKLNVNKFENVTTLVAFNPLNVN